LIISRPRGERGIGGTRKGSKAYKECQQHEYNQKVWGGGFEDDDDDDDDYDDYDDHDDDHKNG
jgi:hypothetical protein